MGCAMGLIRCLVFLFNLICALAGLALIVVGVLFVLNFRDVTETLESSPIGVAPLLMIVVGGVIFVIAFFGCCGAMRESTCMLTTYAVVILILFALQIALGIYAFLQIKDETDLRRIMRNDVQKSFDRYYHDKHSQQAFDLLQHTIKCCGVNGPRDWTNVPDSCCPNNKGCHLSSFEIYNEGCAEKSFTFVKSNISIIGIVLLALSAAEIVAAIFSLCLSSSINNSLRRNGYA